VRFTFSENVLASLEVGDLVLADLTHGGTVPTSSIDVSYDLGSNTAIFTFPGFAGGVLPEARYRATIVAGTVEDGSGNALAADADYEFTFLRGDANGDGQVNLADFNILAANFGQPNRNFTQGDFNYDGTVNLTDFNLLAARFGQALGPDGLSPTGERLTRGQLRSMLDDVLT
jgi:hypothetical protein